MSLSQSTISPSEMFNVEEARRQFEETLTYHFQTAVNLERAIHPGWKLKMKKETNQLRICIFGLLYAGHGLLKLGSRD